MILGEFKREILVSTLCGLLITALIWLSHVLVSARIPLSLFNVMGILGIPGNVITTVIVGIASPEKGWQAIHGVEPYKYISYGTNFIFYSLVIALIQVLFFKWRKKKKIAA